MKLFQKLKFWNSLCIIYDFEENLCRWANFFKKSGVKTPEASAYVSPKLPFF
jgi:hypothetical protein